MRNHHLSFSLWIPSELLCTWLQPSTAGPLASAAESFLEVGFLHAVSLHSTHQCFSEHSLHHREGLVKTMLSSSHRVSKSTALGWSSLRICISNKFPDEAPATREETTQENNTSDLSVVLIHNLQTHCPDFHTLQIDTTTWHLLSSFHIVF